MRDAYSFTLLIAPMMSLTSLLQLAVIASWVLYRLEILQERERQKLEDEQPREWLSPSRQTRPTAVNDEYFSPGRALLATPALSARVQAKQPLFGQVQDGTRAAKQEAATANAECEAARAEARAAVARAEQAEAMLDEMRKANTALQTASPARRPRTDPPPLMPPGYMPPPKPAVLSSRYLNPTLEYPPSSPALDPPKKESVRLRVQSWGPRSPPKKILELPLPPSPASRTATARRDLQPEEVVRLLIEELEEAMRGLKAQRPALKVAETPGSMLAPRPAGGDQMSEHGTPTVTAAKVFLETTLETLQNARLSLERTWQSSAEQAAATSRAIGEASVAAWTVASEGVSAVLSPPKSTGSASAKQWIVSFGPGRLGLALQYSPSLGAVVSSTVRGSPAHERGVPPGSRMVSVGGKSVRDLSEGAIMLLIANTPRPVEIGFEFLLDTNKDTTKGNSDEADEPVFLALASQKPPPPAPSTTSNLPSRPPPPPPKPANLPPPPSGQAPSLPRDPPPPPKPNVRGEGVRRTLPFASSNEQHNDGTEAIQPDSA